MTGLVVAGLVAAGLIVVGLACARRPPPAPSRGWGTRLRRGVIRGIVVAIGAFAVVRAGFVIAADDLSHPETYRNDWGGPHYIGVMAIHVGPAVLVTLAALVRCGGLLGRGCPRRPDRCE